MQFSLIFSMVSVHFWAVFCCMQLIPPTIIPRKWLVLSTIRLPTGWLSLRLRNHRVVRLIPSLDPKKYSNSSWHSQKNESSSDHNTIKSNKGQLNMCTLPYKHTHSHWLACCWF